MATIDASSEPNIEQSHNLRFAGLAAYTATVGITFAALAVTLICILAFASEASFAAKLAIALYIVGVAAFGTLAGRAQMDEIKAIIDDGIAGKPGKHAAHLGALPIPLFSSLTVVFVVVIALAQLFALFYS